MDRCRQKLPGFRNRAVVATQRRSYHTTDQRLPCVRHLQRPVGPPRMEIRAKHLQLARADPVRRFRYL
eukprot:3643264-Pyramimonas_sp.AAC.1